MKRIISTMLALLMMTLLMLTGMVFIAPVTVAATSDVWDGTVDTSLFDNYTSQNSFTITTPAQLAGLSEFVNAVSDNSRSFAGKTYPKTKTILSVTCPYTSRVNDAE